MKLIYEMYMMFIVNYIMILICVVVIIRCWNLCCKFFGEVDFMFIGIMYDKWFW